jgi:hypothetical protein
MAIFTGKLRVKILINIREIVIIHRALGLCEELLDAGRVQRNPLIVLITIPLIVPSLIIPGAFLNIYPVTNISNLYDSIVWQIRV